jgi:hypothetical protein
MHTRGHLTNISFLYIHIIKMICAFIWRICMKSNIQSFTCKSIENFTKDVVSNHSVISLFNYVMRCNLQVVLVHQNRT